MGSPLRADDAQASKLAALKTWFKNLKDGLSDSAVRSHFQKQRSVGSVAAVRGEGQASADPDRPEWKTSTKSEKAEFKKERQELAAAVDQIMGGKLVEGRASLDAFEKAHPKSRLLKDVAQARENASTMESLSAAPADAKASDAKTQASAAPTDGKK
jgi:hypothetical protein